MMMSSWYHKQLDGWKYISYISFELFGSKLGLQVLSVVISTNI